MFREGGQIGGLGAVDGAGTGEQKAAGPCGHGQIENVAGALHDLVVALQRREAGGTDGKIETKSNPAPRMLQGILERPGTQCMISK